MFFLVLCLWLGLLPLQASLGFDGIVGVVRRLLFGASRLFYRFIVWLRVNGSCVLPPFTGKVVKSLLIKCNPRLVNVFESRIFPKPIRVSTLFRRDGYFLWKRRGCEGVVGIDNGGVFGFVIGCYGEYLDDIVLAIDNLHDVELFGCKWSVIELTVECFRIPSKEPFYSLDDVDVVKVVFRTPALFIDPFKPSKFRRFAPISGFVFSYNIGDVARLEREPDYISLINLFSAIVVESHSCLDTCRRVFYIYDDKELPGVIGYVNYHLENDILSSYPEFKLFIENVLTHAYVMGVGSSRADGFGHVDIALIKSSQGRGD